MKKVSLVCIIISLFVLSGCSGDNKSDIQKSNKTTSIEIEMDENYDDADPFVNERIFCVSEDLAILKAEVSLEMEGESGTLEVKNNATNEILWSDTWNGNIKSDIFSVSFEDLDKNSEYSICFTGTKIDNAYIKFVFQSSTVQELEKPSR